MMERRIIDQDFIIKMSEKRVSDPRPSAWEADALPTELFSHEHSKIIKTMFSLFISLTEFLQF